MKNYIKEIGTRLLIIGINIIEVVLVFIPGKRVSLSKYIHQLEEWLEDLKEYN